MACTLDNRNEKSRVVLMDPPDPLVWEDYIFNYMDMPDHIYQGRTPQPSFQDPTGPCISPTAEICALRRSGTEDRHSALQEYTRVRNRVMDEATLAPRYRHSTGQANTRRRGYVYVQDDLLTPHRQYNDSSSSSLTMQHKNKKKIPTMDEDPNLWEVIELRKE
eukprot:Ihof_evm2s1124 gene=Ihof_evmTU2s1124